MLRRFLIALPLMILALVVTDRASLIIAPCSEYDSAQNYRDGADKNKCASREGVIIAGIEWLAEISPEAWTALATVAIAAFTVVLAIVGYTQAKLTRAALELTRFDFISTHRPRVIVRFIQGPFHRPDDTQFIWVTIVNIGPTIAIIKEFGCDLARRKGKLWKMPGADGAPKKIDPIRLISGDRYWFEVTSKASYTDAEIFADALDTEELCAFGAILYGDESGTVRETGFFRIYDPKSEKFIPSEDSSEEYQD